MKDFLEQLNDMVAPLSRAYSEPVIVKLEIAPGDIKDDSAEFRIVLRCKRTPMFKEVAT